MRFSIIRARAICGLIGLGACVLGGAPALAGEEVVVDGVPHVMNGSTPGQAGETLHLSELWRVGGLDDEENLFGLVIDAMADEEGNVYLLDLQLSNVQVFSLDGENLKTLGREGEGPGEVRRPSDMLFMPDGTLGIVQTFPGKIVKVDMEGNPAGALELGGDPTSGGIMALVDADFRAGNMVLAGVRVVVDGTRQDRVNYLASFSTESEELARYWEKSVHMDFADLTLREGDQYMVYPRRWAIGPRGEVYLAPRRGEYYLEVYSADGTLERVIEREFVNRPRTAQERELIANAMDNAVAQLPGEVETKIEDTEPAITQMRVAGDGSLWVVHSSSSFEQPAGIMTTYDVFDPRGDFARQVSIACDGDGRQDRLLFVGEERIVLIKGLLGAALAMGGISGGGDEEEPLEIICYRIEKG